MSAVQANETLLGQQSFRDLIATGQIREVELKSGAGGWAIIVRAGMMERMLRTRRGEPKTFVRSDSAISYLRGLGIGRIVVDAADLPSAKQRGLFDRRVKQRRS